MQEVQLFIKDINNVDEVTVNFTSDYGFFNDANDGRVDSYIKSTDLFSSGNTLPQVGDIIYRLDDPNNIYSHTVSYVDSSLERLYLTSSGASMSTGTSMYYNTIYNNPKLKRVDLFNDETISLTQSIQNVKDIAKVFTDFTKTFTLPANAEVNKLFKHYYNFDIVGGFDARLKVDALIKLNGVDFKEGKIKLEGVDLKDNKPQSYRITFFGKLVELKDLIGDDKIDELPFLNKFEINYNSATVKDYLTTFSNNVTIGSETFFKTYYNTFNHTF